MSFELEEEEEAFEHTLLVVREVSVFNIPSRSTSGGYKCGEWLQSDKIWSGRLRVVSCNNRCDIQLEDPNSGDLFASCFVHPGQMENVVEPVLDSSRYFVLKIEDRLSYPFVVKACGELEMYRFGLSVHGMVLSGGVDSNTFVGNSLMGMYMSFGEYDSDNIHTLVYI